MAGIFESHFDDWQNIDNLRYLNFGAAFTTSSLSTSAVIKNTNVGRRQLAGYTLSQEL